MKKISFILPVLMAVLLLASCQSDSNCSFDGNWKVKSVDFQSASLPQNLIDMAKEDALGTTYEFTADGKIKISIRGMVSREGSFSFEKASQQLMLKTQLTTGQTSEETYQVDACTGNEISLFQRTPADTTRAEIARTTLVLEKIQ